MGKGWSVADRFQQRVLVHLSLFPFILPDPFWQSPDAIDIDFPERANIFALPIVLCGLISLSWGWTFRKGLNIIGDQVPLGCGDAESALPIRKSCDGPVKFNH